MTRKVWVDGPWTIILDTDKQERLEKIQRPVAEAMSSFVEGKRWYVADPPKKRGHPFGSKNKPKAKK